LAVAGVPLRPLSLLRFLFGSGRLGRLETSHRPARFYVCLFCRINLSVSGVVFSPGLYTGAADLTQFQAVLADTLENNRVFSLISGKIV
jgi:hypothetical protein